MTPKGQRSTKHFSLSNKLSWLKFNSWICVLLKSSLVIFLDTKNVVLTFDPLGLSKKVIPFFHWALQLFRHYGIRHYGIRHFGIRYSGNNPGCLGLSPRPINTAWGFPQSVKALGLYLIHRCWDELSPQPYCATLASFSHPAQLSLPSGVDMNALKEAAKKCFWTCDSMYQ